MQSADAVTSQLLLCILFPSNMRGRCVGVSVAYSNQEVGSDDLAC